MIAARRWKRRELGLYLGRFYLRVLLAMVAAAIPLRWIQSHLAWNVTASVPLGLYWLSSAEEVRRGDIVAFPVPASVAPLVVERRYLPPGAVLLKPVVAVAGDTVCIAEDTLFVNGMAFGPVMRADRLGRPLPRTEKCGTVASGDVFVASSVGGSFDSRIFGAVGINAAKKARHLRSWVARSCTLPG